MNLELEDLRKRLFEQPVSQAIAAPIPGTVSSKFNNSHRSSGIQEPQWVEPLMLKAGERASAIDAESAREEDDLAPSLTRQASPAANRDTIQSDLGSGIAQLFGETKHFQLRIDDLHQKLSQLERTYASGDELFAPLRVFHTRLSQFAQSFAAMRTFQFRLAQMAETFEPMKVLHNGLAEVADSFEDHLARLVLSLDPVRGFGERLRQLALTFDQAGQLQAEFLELHSAFRAAAK